MRSLSVPAGALNGVIELSALAASLALTDTHGAVWTFDLPVVDTLRSVSSILSHSAILSSKHIMKAN